MNATNHEYQCLEPDLRPTCSDRTASRASHGTAVFGAAGPPQHTRIATIRSEQFLAIEIPRRRVDARDFLALLQRCTIERGVDLDALVGPRVAPDARWGRPSEQASSSDDEVCHQELPTDGLIGGVDQERPRLEGGSTLRGRSLRLDREFEDCHGASLSCTRSC